MDHALSEDVEYSIVSSLSHPDAVLQCRLVSKRWKNYITTKQLVETFSSHHRYVRFLFSILLFRPFSESCHATLFSDRALYCTLYTIVFKMAAPLKPLLGRPGAQKALYDFMLKANMEMREMRRDVDEHHIAKYLSSVFVYLNRFYARRLSLPPLLASLLVA